MLESYWESVRRCFQIMSVKIVSRGFEAGSEINVEQILGESLQAEDFISGFIHSPLGASAKANWEDPLTKTSRL